MRKPEERFTRSLAEVFAQYFKSANTGAVKVIPRWHGFARKYQDRSKYMPAEEDRKHRGKLS